jgi:D-glycero-D-manno-heptose 1,7-bisphosphate phosphatase
MKPAVFLDRDGVLNESVIKSGRPYPPSKLSDVRIITGVVEAIRLMQESELEIVVVTNQPDFSRGIATKYEIESINNFLAQKLEINHFYTCLHDDSDDCNCRKPKSGLLTKAALDLDLDLQSSFMVGDRWKDIEAGQNVGCTCFFIDYSYCEKMPKEPFFPVASLLAAAREIVRRES